MTETSALDEVEAWVHWEIDKLSKRTMVGDRAIGVGDAEQIAVVAAHRAMELAHNSMMLDAQPLRIQIASRILAALAGATWVPNMLAAAAERGDLTELRAVVESHSLMALMHADFLLQAASATKEGDNDSNMES